MNETGFEFYLHNPTVDGGKPTVIEIYNSKSVCEDKCKEFVAKITDESETHLDFGNPSRNLDNARLNTFAYKDKDTIVNIVTSVFEAMDYYSQSA